MLWQSDLVIVLPVKYKAIAALQLIWFWLQVVLSSFLCYVQANVYRAEKNLIELYVLLLRYSKCVYLVISKSLQMLCYI
jgi:hypothetical protein